MRLLRSTSSAQAPKPAPGASQSLPSKSVRCLAASLESRGQLVSAAEPRAV